MGVWEMDCIVNSATICCITMQTIYPLAVIELKTSILLFQQ
jgi:hypothetical protein